MFGWKKSALVAAGTVVAGAAAAGAASALSRMTPEYKPSTDNVLFVFTLP